VKIWGRLAGYLKSYRLLVVASLAALAVGSLLDGFSMVLLIPFLRSLFGDAAVLPGAGSLVDRVLDVVLGGFLAGASPNEALRNVVVVVMAAIVLKNVFFYAASALGVTVQEGVARDMRNQLYGHLQRLPLGFFDRNKTGQLVARVFTDTNKTKEIFRNTMAEALKHIVSLVAFVLVLLVISWKRCCTDYAADSAAPTTRRVN
jgi:ABC-type multidrug transport system fused ATPase/permease subunit